MSTSKSMILYEMCEVLMYPLWVLLIYLFSDFFWPCHDAEVDSALEDEGRSVSSRSC